MEAMQMSIDRWRDKEAVVPIYNGILLSHKKEHIWVSFNEVDNLEPIIEREEGQKEKDKYCILIHIYGISKDGTDEPIYRAAVEMQT